MRSEYNKNSVESLEALLINAKNDQRNIKARIELLSDVLSHKFIQLKGLTCQYRYTQLSPEHKSKICNGAGAANRWISSFIPNTLYGLDCEEVFNIHDYDYFVGVTQADKDQADMRMFDNLIVLINKTAGFLQWFRRRRAMKYYEAVHIDGDEAFFNKG